MTAPAPAPAHARPCEAALRQTTGHEAIVASSHPPEAWRYLLRTGGCIYTVPSETAVFSRHHVRPSIATRPTLQALDPLAAVSIIQRRLGTLSLPRASQTLPGFTPAFPRRAHVRTTAGLGPFQAVPRVLTSGLEATGKGPSQSKAYPYRDPVIALLPAGPRPLRFVYLFLYLYYTRTSCRLPRSYTSLLPTRQKSILATIPPAGPSPLHPCSLHAAHSNPPSPS